MMMSPIFYAMATNIVLRLVPGMIVRRSRSEEFFAYHVTQFLRVCFKGSMGCWCSLSFPLDFNKSVGKFTSFSKTMKIRPCSGRISEIYCVPLSVIIL